MTRIVQITSGVTNSIGTNLLRHKLHLNDLTLTDIVRGVELYRHNVAHSQVIDEVVGTDATLETNKPHMNLADIIRLIEESSLARK